MNPNTKRRAELQRKLSMKPVPRPPAGLSARIKADIPKYLEAESAGTRFSRAIFNMRVAAAMLLVVTAAAVGVAFLRTAPAEEKGASTVVFAPAPRALSDTSASAPTETVRLEMNESGPVAEVAATGGGAPAVALRRQHAATKPIEGEPLEGEAAGSVAAADSADFVREESPRVQVAEALAPPPPPTVAAPAAAPVPPPSTEGTMTVVAQAPTADFARAPAAARLTANPKGSVFGISVDPEVFQQIRTTLESGGRPAASDVDVEALVNYFAGEPARRPRGVQLEVEASPAAVSAEGDHALLRFSVDTPAATRGDARPIASDALIEIDFNENVVAQATRVGDGDALSRESLLLPGTSVTGLYAIELKPNLKSSQLVAAVSLHYTSSADGRKRTIRREVRGDDLTKTWSRASRRHRLASLGAAWGETLKGTAAGFDVARRAEELATQDPNNARAKELAAAASASGGSSP